MRSFLFIASAVLAFAAAMIFDTTSANAVVCAHGIYRAGCAGYRGAVVVRRPPVVGRYGWVHGIRIRRCV